MSYSSKLISHPHQTLKKHLDGVNEVSKRALDAKYIDPSLASVAAIERWRQLLVYFHDFGKSSVFFQYKIIKAVLTENPEKVGLPQDYIDDFYKKNDFGQLKSRLKQDTRIGSHAALGSYVVQENTREDNILIRLILLEIIKRHHGNLQNFSIDEFSVFDEDRERLTEQWNKTDKLNFKPILDGLPYVLPKNIDDTINRFDGARLFVLDLDGKLPSTDIKPYVLTLFLFSILLAADKGDMMLGSRDQVGEVLLFPLGIVEEFKKVEFGSSPEKAIDILRELAYQLVEKNVKKYSSSPFFSISLPTGLGKTLTAFNAAFVLQSQLAKKYKSNGHNVVPRIIYCLPFTSVIDQNAAVLDRVLLNVGIADGYLARHHYLSDWPSKKATEDELEDSEKEYFTEGWEYPFTVTTFVQLLETIFSNKNRKLRKFHNLINAIVILDEVQNIPPKYFETIEVMFQTLFECFGTRFIFVTATQPFLIAKQNVIELTDPSKQRTKQFFMDMNRITLDLTLWIQGEKPIENLLLLFQQAVQDKPRKSFLFIFNKVKTSQLAFLFLKENNPDAELVYLSAAILPVLRKKRIKMIKNASKEKQLIVVSTQVVEAGVDIDLDIVYRDFAPLDSINQSAGRCNRNGAIEKGEVRLFATEKGASNVYDNILINITTRVLEQKTDELKSLIIPECSFYDLNAAYALNIRKSIVDDNAHSELIDKMKHLQFESVDENFKLISQPNNRYSVFVDFNNDSKKTWEEYQHLKKIKDRWKRKKELRKLRPRLLQFVVQFPEKALPYELVKDEPPIVYLSPDEYEKYYSLMTGYGVFQEEKEAISL